jgi:putative ABC transport system permease protein
VSAATTDQAVPASRLRVRDALAVGGLGLRSRRLRAALSALGIAIGIASLVAVVGISASSRADLIAQLDSLGTNLLTLAPGQSMMGEAATLPEQAPGMLRRIGPVQTVSAVESVDASVRRSDLVPSELTGGIAVMSADPSLLDTVAGTVAQGRWLDPATSRVPAVVLGSTAARRLGIERLYPDLQVWLGERWFTVVGILDPLPLAPELDSAALVGEPIARELLGAEGSASAVYLRAEPEDVEAVRDVAAATANPEHPDEVEVSRPSDALEARAAADETLTALLLGLGAVSLVVGGIGIANVMVIAVLERRGEIGLRRALGATRRHVLVQFLLESLYLAGLGGLVGALAGGAVVVAYASNRGWTPDIPPLGVVAGLGSALVIGALAGLYPALRAARQQPATALVAT